MKKLLMFVALVATLPGIAGSYNPHSVQCPTMKVTFQNKTAGTSVYPAIWDNNSKKYLHGTPNRLVQPNASRIGWIVKDNNQLELMVLDNAKNLILSKAISCQNRQAEFELTDVSPGLYKLSVV